MRIAPDRNTALRKQIVGWLSWLYESVAGENDAGATTDVMTPFTVFRPEDSASDTSSAEQ
jgi:hypothetical protein